MYLGFKVSLNPGSEVNKQISEKRLSYTIFLHIDIS
jgi:hypothetical protein